MSVSLKVMDYISLVCDGSVAGFTAQTAEGISLSYKMARLTTQVVDERIKAR